MRAVLTRVKHASVSIDGKETARIGEGFLILLGVTHEDTEAQAVKLAEKYMSKYYPEWYSRYHKVYKNFDDYTTVKDNEIADQPGTFKAPVGGKFSWDLNGTLSDPDGYADMSADEILADLFDT